MEALTMVTAEATAISTERWQKILVASVTAASLATLPIRIQETSNVSFKN
jgi:hypothetical protein